MNILYRLAGGGVIVAMAAVFGFQSEQKILENYNIQAPSETAFMQRCKTSMDMNDVGFNDGASRSKGCACLTKTLVSSAKSGELKAVETYMAFMMETGGDNARDELDLVQFEKSLADINKRHKLSDSQSLAIFTMVGEAVGTCGDKRFHSAENVAQLASMTPNPATIKFARPNANKPSGVKPDYLAKPKPVAKAAPKPEAKSEPAPKLRGMSKG